ncbi:MAG: beta-ketoacyl synthase N-terminal-like domain-containing protein [Pseudomonadota bacterium]|nr:beta-ketoacyl synthase N-terminal-like domain-containing protein [Pseudomonadota bacterium]
MQAVSAAGWGVDALVDAVVSGRSLARPVPWATEALRSPFAALANAGSAEDMLLSVVESVAPGEGAGLVVATSSGAISGPFEAWHRDTRASGHPAETWAWRQLPTARVAARLGLAPHRTLSVACASGTAAFEVARGWLRAGRCERVVVAGVDALSLYIHAGFAGLGALAKGGSRPFAVDRDGLVLGEGAAAFLLETPASARASGRTPLAALLGCGLSQDGVHLTAPDRTGAGLGRAARAALIDAGLEPGDIGVVSAHATATVFNDAMEARALAALFEGPVPLHACKPVLGHTLGAAGALEAAVLLAILEGAPAPAPLSVTAPDCPMTVAPCRDPRHGLSVSAAFGGVNAAVVFGPASGELRSEAALRPVHAAATARVATDDLPLARVFPGAPPTLGRADAYVRGGIAALAALRSAAAQPSPAPLSPETAVVLASASNCHAADLRYHAGLLDGGPAQASRLHFSYTVPGAPVAEASILLGLRGPVLVFCDPGECADEEARRLVSQGIAPSAVALAIEAPGSFAEAVATLYVPS